MSNQNKLLVPESRDSLNQLKVHVMKEQGYSAEKPADIKYEVADSLGIPLNHGYNGNLEAKSAGKIGGKIGGSMVREMIRLAQEKISSHD